MVADDRTCQQLLALRPNDDVELSSLSLSVHSRPSSPVSDLKSNSDMSNCLTNDLERKFGHIVDQSSQIVAISSI